MKIKYTSYQSFLTNILIMLVMFTNFMSCKGCSELNDSKSSTMKTNIKPSQMPGEPRMTLPREKSPLHFFENLDKNSSETLLTNINSENRSQFKKKIQQRKQAIKQAQARPISEPGQLSANHPSKEPTVEELGKKFNDLGSKLKSKPDQVELGQLFEDLGNDIQKLEAKDGDLDEDIFVDHLQKMGDLLINKLGGKKQVENKIKNFVNSKPLIQFIDQSLLKQLLGDQLMSQIGNKNLGDVLQDQPLMENLMSAINANPSKLKELQDELIGQVSSITKQIIKQFAQPLGNQLNDQQLGEELTEQLAALASYLVGYWNI